jgi:hypothetical protein
MFNIRGTSNPTDRRNSTELVSSVQRSYSQTTGFFQQSDKLPRSKGDKKRDSPFLYRKFIQPLASRLDEVKQAMRNFETVDHTSEEVGTLITLLENGIATARRTIKQTDSEDGCAIKAIAPWLDFMERELPTLQARLTSVLLTQQTVSLVNRELFDKLKTLEREVRLAQQGSYISGPSQLARIHTELGRLQLQVNALKKEGEAWARAKERSLGQQHHDVRTADAGFLYCCPEESLLPAESRDYTKLCNALDGLSARLADAAAALAEMSPSLSLLSLFLSHPADGTIVNYSSHGKWVAQMDQLNPEDRTRLLAKVSRRVLDPDAMQRIGDEVRRGLDQGWSRPMIMGLMGVAMKQYLGSFGMATVLVKNSGYPEFLLLAAFMNKVMECALVNDRVGNVNPPDGGGPCVKWSTKMLTDSMPMVLFLAALCLSDLWVQSRGPQQPVGWTKPEGARDMTLRLACGMMGATATMLASNGLRHALGGSFRYVSPSMRGSDYSQIFRIFCNGPRFFGALSRMLSLVPVVVALRMGLVENNPYWTDFILIGGWMVRDLAYECFDACNFFQPS